MLTILQRRSAPLSWQGQLRGRGAPRIKPLRKRRADFTADPEAVGKLLARQRRPDAARRRDSATRRGMVKRYPDGQHPHPIPMVNKGPASDGKRGCEVSV